MKRSILLRMGVSSAAVCALFLSGCATVNHDRDYLTNGTVSGSRIAGFTPYQSAKEAKETITKMGYKNAPHSGLKCSIDDLIDESRREYFIGIPIGLERVDEATGLVVQVDLKFNYCYTLENILVTHRVNSENDKGIFQFYLERYPMLVFVNSEEGVDYNPVTGTKEKITNTDYHFDDGQYAFLHLNRLRTHKEDGRYEDVIKFNVHDSREMAAEAYKRPLIVPAMADEFPMDHDH